MNTVDIIILVCFIPALYEGITKGFISQAIALVSIILGAWLAFHFSAELGEWLTQYLPGISPEAINITAFVVVIILTILILTLVAKFLNSIIKLVMLGWLNKLLGILFAILKAALIIGIIIVAFTSLNDITGLVDKEVLDSSQLFNPIKNFTVRVFPYLKALIFKQ